MTVGSDSSSGGGRRVAAVAAVGLLALAGCASVGPATVSDEQIGEAVAHLSRPLPDNMAALYGLRVSRTGSLRMSVLVSGDRGRLTVSQPFGAALSITGWSAAPPMVLADVKHGCSRRIVDLREVFEVSGLPIHQAVRLLGGRLPTVVGDRIEPEPDGRVLIRGPGWAASVVIGVDPWRVLAVEERRADGVDGWRVALDDHARSVPGRIRLTGPDGRWAELDLKAIEWPATVELPALPDLPPCRGRAE